MSTDDTNSILTNLKNKISYNIQQAVTDPQANEYAKQQKEKKDEKAKLASEEKTYTQDKTDGDPNTFNGMRVVKKIGTQTLNIIKMCLLPFTALMLSMIVTNEFIVYSAPIRILFFLFTFLLCFFLPFYAIILTIFYLFKGGYSYYINNMTDGPKKNIMPTIFALLPITTYKPQSPIGAFFMYPFTYPKTEVAELKLPESMREYWNSLVESFKGFDSVKNLPIFVDDVRKIQSEIMNLHTTEISRSN